MNTEKQRIKDRCNSLGVEFFLYYKHHDLQSVSVWLDHIEEGDCDWLPSRSLSTKGNKLCGIRLFGGSGHAVITDRTSIRVCKSNEILDRIQTIGNNYAMIIDDDGKKQKRQLFSGANNCRFCYASTQMYFSSLTCTREGVVVPRTDFGYYDPKVYDHWLKFLHCMNDPNESYDHWDAVMACFCDKLTELKPPFSSVEEIKRVPTKSLTGHVVTKDGNLRFC